MDLDKIEGLNLSEEQKAAILAQNEEDISGLKSKNEQLLSEKKTVQQSEAEKAAELEAARKEKVAAEEAKLIAEGKYKEAQELREKETAELTEKYQKEAEAAKGNLTKFHKGQALNGALSLIHDDFKGVSSAMLSNMINVDYNDDGEAITTFVHEGQIIAKNVE